MRTINLAVDDTLEKLQCASRDYFLHEANPSKGLRQPEG
jgi:hypothetical protein